MLFSEKFMKLSVILGTCMLVIIALKIGKIDFIYTDMMKPTQAMLDAHEQDDTKWITYYESLLNETRFNYTPYNLKEHHCDEQFYSKMKENMKTVLNYPVITRMKQQYFDIYQTFQNYVNIGNRSEKYPVVVTASSSNRFARSLAMIKSVKENLLPVYKKMQFIFFDLGLSKEELSSVKKFCNCEVRHFPFHEYPPFVSQLFNYAWKPIIIYMMLREFNFVMWADASFNFNGNKQATDNFFMTAKETGVLGQRLDDKFRSYFYTKEETFRYLNETPCLFYLSQIEASCITIWKTPFTWKYIVQPWLACTLTENCMSHPDPQAVLPCKQKDTPHWCHRFDQSVLSIILQRLFNTNIDLVSFNRLPAIGQVNRDQQLFLRSLST